MAAHTFSFSFFLFFAVSMLSVIFKGRMQNKGYGGHFVPKGEGFVKEYLKSNSCNLLGYVFFVIKYHLNSCGSAAKWVQCCLD